MKILLNILPDEKKKTAEQRMRFRFFVWQVFLLFSLELFLASFLFVISLWIHFERQHQEILNQEFDSRYTEEKQQRIFEEKFQSVNEAADAVLSINKKHFSFTQVFLLLDRHISDAITLEHVSTKDFKIFLSGTADTRDDLLVFSEKLKGEPCFSDVKLPLSNLLTQNQVDFQIDITIRPSCLYDTSL